MARIWRSKIERGRKYEKYDKSLPIFVKNLVSWRNSKREKVENYDEWDHW